MKGFALEVGLHWVAVGCYAVGSVLLAHAVMFDRPARVRRGIWLFALGLLPHALALGLRWYASGHGPYMSQYEVLSSNAWVLVALLLGFLWRKPSWAPLAVLVLPAAVLMIGLGLFSVPQMRELPPSLRSFWLIFH